MQNHLPNICKNISKTVLCYAHGFFKVLHENNCTLIFVNDQRYLNRLVYGADLHSMQIEWVVLATLIEIAIVIQKGNNEIVIGTCILKMKLFVFNQQLHLANEIFPS